MANAFLTLVQESDGNNTKNAQLYNQSGKDKGKIKSNNATTREEVRKILDGYGFSPDKLTVKMLTTADGLAEIKLTMPELYERFNSFYGQSKPKMPKGATPFRFGELTALLTDNKGRIKEGYFADMAVLDTDIFTCDPAAIKDTQSVLTVVGGKIVYEA
jgi:hypothetical protein